MSAGSRSADPPGHRPRCSSRERGPPTRPESAVLLSNAASPARILTPESDGYGAAYYLSWRSEVTDVNAEETREQHADQPAQRGTKWWTLVAVCLGTFMLLLDITIVNVALPDIQRALSSSFSDLQWIVDAYALTLAAFLLTAGSLADMYGRRLLYLIGLAVFTCASVLCGFATSTLMLQLSRALQGVGGAIMFAVSLALLADAFRGKDRGVAFGVWAPSPASPSPSDRCSVACSRQGFRGDGSSS